MNDIQARRMIEESSAICAASPPANIGEPCHASTVPNVNGNSMLWQDPKDEAGGAQSKK
jgi:hypothetical protein